MYSYLFWHRDNRHKEFGKVTQNRNWIVIRYVGCIVQILWVGVTELSFRISGKIPSTSCFRKISITGIIIIETILLVRFDYFQTIL